jgi:RNA polymerase sigma factor (sigma-70 family)
MLARLARLPRRQRAAVVLRFYVGLSDAEIAAHLGCREGTVRSQISRALAGLRLDPSPATAVAPTLQEST